MKAMKDIHALLKQTGNLKSNLSVQQGLKRIPKGGKVETTVILHIHLNYVFPQFPLPLQGHCFSPQLPQLHTK